MLHACLWLVIGYLPVMRGTGAWVPQGDGGADPPGCLQRPEEAEEDQKGAEAPLLGRDLPRSALLIVTMQPPPVMLVTWLLQFSCCTCAACTLARANVLLETWLLQHRCYNSAAATVLLQLLLLHIAVSARNWNRHTFSCACIE